MSWRLKSFVFSQISIFELSKIHKEGWDTWMGYTHIAGTAATRRIPGYARKKIFSVDSATAQPSVEKIGKSELSLVCTVYICTCMLHDIFTRSVVTFCRKIPNFHRSGDLARSTRFEIWFRPLFHPIIAYNACMMSDVYRGGGVTWYFGIFGTSFSLPKNRFFCWALWLRGSFIFESSTYLLICIY